MVPPARARPLAADRPGLRTVLIAVLSLAALLTGVLAMHSGAQMPVLQTGSHGVHADHADPVAETAAVTGAASGHTTATMTTSRHGAPDGLPCGGNCALDCAVMVMLCVLLVTLAVIVHLAIAPALHRLLLEALRRVAVFRQDTVIPALRPSLIVLSISRT